MKVRIDGKWYDADKEPIVIHLSSADKKNIKNMYSECFYYLVFPEDMPKEVIQEIDEEIDILKARKDNNV